MANTILGIPAAQTQSGYSRSTIYLRITQGLWPRQISLGPRAIGWPATEIEALNAARISGKTDDEIRLLVPGHCGTPHWPLTKATDSRKWKAVMLGALPPARSAV